MKPGHINMRRKKNEMHDYILQLLKDIHCELKMILKQYKSGQYTHLVHCLTCLEDVAQMVNELCERDDNNQ